MSGSFWGSAAFQVVCENHLSLREEHKKYLFMFNVCVCACVFRRSNVFSPLLETLRCDKQQPFAQSPCGNLRFKALNQVRWRLKVGWSSRSFYCWHNTATPNSGFSSKLESKKKKHTKKHFLFWSDSRLGRRSPGRCSDMPPPPVWWLCTGIRAGTRCYNYGVISISSWLLKSGSVYNERLRKHFPPYFLSSSPCFFARLLRLPPLIFSPYHSEWSPRNLPSVFELKVWPTLFYVLNKKPSIIPLYILLFLFSALTWSFKIKTPQLKTLAQWVFFLLAWVGGDVGGVGGWMSVASFVFSDHRSAGTTGVASGRSSVAHIFDLHLRSTCKELVHHHQQ